MSPGTSNNLYVRGCAHGIMFHRFHRSHESDQSQGALTPDDFERLLLHVGIENIRSPQEWLSRLGKNRLGERDLCITFDDGLRSQVEYALPVLDRYGLQAFWFIYSSVFEGKPLKSEIYSHAASQIGGMDVLIEEFFDRCPSDIVDHLKSDEFSAYVNVLREEGPFYSTNDLKYRFLRGMPQIKPSFEALMDQIIKKHGFDLEEVSRRLWLTEADLKALTERGHHVGLHSYDHPYELARLTYAEQLQQYEKNYAHIFSVTQQRPIGVSHPLNSYNEHSLAVLQRLGIRCGFRSNMAPPSPAQRINPHCLELAREDAANVLSALKNPRSLAHANSHSA
jgi:peptidoglycan/xylan/chitin deacetylase (PgdA/CDA1 family)